MQHGIFSPDEASGVVSGADKVAGDLVAEARTDGGSAGASGWSLTLGAEFDCGNHFARVGGPCEGLRLAVVLVEEAVDGRLKIGDLAERRTPNLNRIGKDMV